jgi:hypothetical protein
VRGFDACAEPGGPGRVCRSPAVGAIVDQTPLGRAGEPATSRAQRCTSRPAPRALTPASTARRPLDGEQRALTLEAAAVAAERATAVDHSVAGDDDRQRVVTGGVPDRADAVGTSQAARELAVAERLSVWDPGDAVPDAWSKLAPLAPSGRSKTVRWPGRTPRAARQQSRTAPRRTPAGRGWRPGRWRAPRSRSSPTSSSSPHWAAPPFVGTSRKRGTLRVSDQDTADFREGGDACERQRDTAHRPTAPTAPPQTLAWDEHRQRTERRHRLLHRPGIPAVLVCCAGLGEIRHCKAAVPTLPLTENAALIGVGGAPADTRLSTTAGWVVSGGHGGDSVGAGSGVLL